MCENFDKKLESGRNSAVVDVFYRSACRRGQAEAVRETKIFIFCEISKKIAEREEYDRRDSVSDLEDRHLL